MSTASWVQMATGEPGIRRLQAVDAFTEGGAIRDDITALVIEYAPEAA